MDAAQPANPANSPSDSNSSSTTSDNAPVPRWLKWLEAQLGWLAGPTNTLFLFIFLLLAIALTSEIVTRNEDYARVVAYQKGLVACQTGTAPAGTACPHANPEEYKTANLTDEAAKREAIKQADAKAMAFWAEVATTQVRRYNTLNSLGAPNRCHITAVIASEIGHFWEDCQIVLAEPDYELRLQLYEQQAARARAGNQPLPTGPPPPKAMYQPENRTFIQTLLAPSWHSFSRLGLDEQPKEPLYFMLVLFSAAIGSLVAGLHTPSFTTHRDIALGVGVGFAVYILLRGGNFVFFTGGTSIDVLNPFTASGVGLLVGLFKDKAFGLLSNAMPTTLSKPAPQATASPEALQNAQLAQSNAVAATTKTHEGLVEALKKAEPGTEAYKMLQDMTFTALDAKTKAAEAAKAQGEAAKTK